MYNKQFKNQPQNNRILIRIIFYLLIVLAFLLVIGSSMSFKKAENDTKVSWYGPGFHGKLTANGEIYNQDDLTCASPILPFNTLIEITNPKNSKSVIVRVNDRGPYHCYKDTITGRIKPYRPLEAHPTRGFDLSKAAFDSIGNVDKGILKVKYKILQRGIKNKK